MLPSRAEQLTEEGLHVRAAVRERQHTEDFVDADIALRDSWEWRDATSGNATSRRD
jgi:hypothetical protein